MNDFSQLTQFPILETEEDVSNELLQVNTTTSSGTGIINSFFGNLFRSNSSTTANTSKQTDNKDVKEGKIYGL